jgi:hypothetical protein
VRRFSSIIAVSALVVVACSCSEQRTQQTAPLPPHGSVQNSVPRSLEATPAANVPTTLAATHANGAPGLPTGTSAPAPPALPRKIKYNSDVKLAVADFDEARQGLHQLIRANDSYIAQSEVTGSSGAPRSGHWNVRVPVERFDAFMEAVLKLGVPEKDTTDSQDVTEQYYDLDARVKNKKAEENRLRTYLEEKKLTSTLDEIFHIERELSRVRGEIEQHEGRLRLLANLTDLATVSITLQEINSYVAPQTPTFASTLSETFQGSLGLLSGLGKILLLIAAALVPWIPMLAMLSAAAWFLIRRRRPRPRQV